MLIRSTLREIKSSLARYLAIFAIVALGVGFFCGLKMCRSDMLDTADKYLSEHNFYDYEIMSSYGVDDESTKLALATSGVVAAETSIQKDILIKTTKNGEPVESALKAISVPEKINTINLVEGRMPKKDDECVIDNYTAVGIKFNVGDVLTLSDTNSSEDLDSFKYRKYKIVGKVNSPLYLDYERGNSSLGNGDLETFFYINKGAFNMDACTQMYIRLEGGKEYFSSLADNKISRYKVSMETLSEKVTESRLKKVKADAQSELDANKTEYTNGMAEFKQKKADTERQLKSAQAEIDNNRQILAANKKEVEATIADLEGKKSAVEDGIRQAEIKLAELEEAYRQRLIDEERYIEQKAIIEATINELNQNKAQLEEGLHKAKAGLAEILVHEKELDAGQNELDANRIKARNELAKAEEELASAKAKIDDAQNKIDTLKKGDSYALSREDNMGYSTFEENANIVSNIAKIFPLFFFLVAALVVMTTMTRMIDEQRSQIGVLRALGYSNFTIRNIYLFYSGSASLLGSVVGFFAGCLIFPTTIWKAYTMMYDFSAKVSILHEWKLGIGAMAVAMICAMGATWFSCAGEFREEPAELIRPKAPPAGKKILLEKFTVLWDRLNFMQKVSLRNVFRYKKRFFMMVLGIAGCTALLVAGAGIKSSISDVAKFQYSEINKYDYQVVFNENMDDSGQSNFLAETKTSAGNFGKTVFLSQNKVTTRLKKTNKNLTVYACQNDEVTKFVNLAYKGEKIAFPNEGEAVVSRKLEKQNDVKIGDKLKLRSDNKEMTVKVSGFYDNYVGETMFMTISTFEKGFGTHADINTMLVISPDSMSKEEISKQAAEISRNEKVATVVLAQNIIDQVDSMMKSLNAIIYVVILCAGLLAFIVLYNLTNINILERIREIATIKVLGFHRGETAQYVFRENIVLTVIAAIVGLPLGYWLLNFVLDNIKIDTIFFVSKLGVKEYVFAFVVTCIFTFIVNLIMRPKLGKISMTESLKTME